MSYADALSRLPLAKENDNETQNLHAFTEEIPIDRRMIQEEMEKILYWEMLCMQYGMRLTLRSA